MGDGPDMVLGIPYIVLIFNFIDGLLRRNDAATGGVLHTGDGGSSDRRDRPTSYGRWREQ